MAQGKKKSDFRFFEGSIQSSLSKEQRALLEAETKAPRQQQKKRPARSPLYDDEELDEAEEDRRRPPPPPLASKPKPIAIAADVETAVPRYRAKPDTRGVTPDTAFELPSDPDEVVRGRTGASKAFEQQAGNEGFASLPKEVKQQLIAERYGKQIEGLRVPHECIRCETKFREIDNMGRWECMYHPGRLGFAGNGSVWSCCRKTVQQERGRVRRGCTPCDHSVVHIAVDSPEPISTVVPVVLLPIIRPNREAVFGVRKAGSGREMESTAHVLRAVRRDSEAVNAYRETITAGYVPGPDGSPVPLYQAPKGPRIMKPMFSTGQDKVDLAAIDRYESVQTV